MIDLTNERDNEWKEKLSALAYRVTREGATEKPFSGEYYMEKRDGNYHCICCGHILFNSSIDKSLTFLSMLLTFFSNNLNR